MKKLPTVVAICRQCVDYAQHDAALYQHGDGYRHLLNGRARCPGQGDDETDDTATPMSFAEFRAEHDDDFVASVLTTILEDFAQASGR